MIHAHAAAGKSIKNVAQPINACAKTSSTLAGEGRGEGNGDFGTDANKDVNVMRFYV